MMKLHFLSVPLLALLVLPHVGGGDSKVPAKQWKLMLTPLEIKPADGTLRKLLIERYNELTNEMQLVIALKSGDQPHPWYDEALVDASRRIFAAVLDFDDARERKELLKSVLGQVTDFENRYTTLEKTLKDNRIKIQLSRFRSLRLEVEYHILKAKKA